MYGVVVVVVSKNKPKLPVIPQKALPVYGVDCNTLFLFKASIRRPYWLVQLFSYNAADDVYIVFVLAAPTPLLPVPFVVYVSS